MKAYWILYFVSMLIGVFGLVILFENTSFLITIGVFLMCVGFKLQPD